MGSFVLMLEFSGIVDGIVVGVVEGNARRLFWGWGLVQESE